MARTKKHGPGKAGRSQKRPGQAAKLKDGGSAKPAQKPTQKPTQKPAQKKQKANKTKQQQNQKPVIPFKSGDRVLLVGEGDFSFSASLAMHPTCHRILATCYDSEEVVHEKYPQAKQHIEQFISAQTTGGVKRNGEDDDEGNDASDDGDKEDEQDPKESADDQKEGEEKPREETSFPKVLYSIDARKLGSTGGGGKLILKGIPRLLPSATPKPWKKGPSTEGQRKVKTANSEPWKNRPTPEQQRKREIADSSGPWDLIAFNFPHVGGLSTDVNRQVRANQEMLTAFFKACVPLLSAPPTAEELDASDDEDEVDEGGEKTNGIKLRTEPGQIVVTLFEGEPYTLWNIRDLARHSGLRVVTSFKFPWACYPAYSHARTLGEIEGKDGERGGWRGEDREARSYVFERKEHETPSQKSAGKRKRGKDDSDDE